MGLLKKILIMGSGVVLILTGCAKKPVEAVPIDPWRDRPPSIAEYDLQMYEKEVIEQREEKEANEVFKCVFKITAYCPCELCCGKSDGITATGTIATEGRTVAVDPKVIPYGSTVVINGNEYVAEDTGGSIKGNKIDIFFESHNAALEWGVKELEVIICD